MPYPPAILPLQSFHNGLNHFSSIWFVSSWPKGHDQAPIEELWLVKSLTVGYGLFQITVAVWLAIFVLGLRRDLASHIFVTAWIQSQRISMPANPHLQNTLFIEYIYFSHLSIHLPIWTAYTIMTGHQWGLQVRPCQCRAKGGPGFFNDKELSHRKAIN
jgi:hypothetical protein